jgi:hypothetical protein
VDKHVRVESLEGGVPLIGEVAIVANVQPMRVMSTEAIVGVDNDDFAMRAEHSFQLFGVLLFTRPVEYERLHSHRASSGNVECADPITNW